jgi:hypothetical protein
MPGSGRPPLVAVSAPESVKDAGTRGVVGGVTGGCVVGCVGEELPHAMIVSVIAAAADLSRFRIEDRGPSVGGGSL